MIAGWRTRDWPALPGLLLLAAALRLPNLATRGTWDADQGHDMLMLRALVRDGVVPLLGPPTSIGDVHHGALYYFLLAPAAALTGGDSPLAVVAWIALAGIAAVGVTWWLARSMAGPVAGLVAGLAMAISPAAVDESTFIWNPNLIALSSAVALAGAWRAWTTRRPAWWLLAAVGTAVTMQCHVLGVTLLPVIGALLVADVRRRAAADERRTLIRVGAGGAAIIGLSFLPLVIHELTSNFSEVQAALAYLRSGGDPSTVAPIARLLIVAGRVVSWPLVGLITTGASAAILAVIGIVALATWRFVSAVGPERVAARWLTLGLAWTALALTVISPSLATVTEGLPNDHYHAFADPMVFVLLGIGAAALWRLEGLPGWRGADNGPAAATSGGSSGWRGSAIEPGEASRSAAATSVGATVASAAATGRLPVGVGRLLAVVGLVGVVAWAATHQPPAVAPDGGFPAAESAASRIEATAALYDPIRIVSLPAFKSPEAYAYPLVRDDRVVIAVRPIAEPTIAGSNLIILCDSLFEEAIGRPCGGPAEDAVAAAEGYGAPRDRFRATPRQSISIYIAPQGSVAP